MEAIINQFASVIRSGLAIELSHFLITLVLLGLTVSIIYRLLLIIENRKYRMSNMFKKDLRHDLSWLPDKAQLWIKKNEKATNVSIMPLITKYVIIGLLIVLTIPIIPFFVSQNTIGYMLIVACMGVFVVYMPFHIIKTMRINRQNKINLELPEYLESFALLKQQQSLFQATMNSVRFAGPTIKPYVDQLVLDVQLNPGSNEPYQTFAKKLNQVDVSTFMNTMVETANVDQKLENELVADELKQIARMRSDVYNAIIEEVEAKVGMRNMIISMPILIIILVFMFYTIATIIKDSGIF